MLRKAGVLKLRCFGTLAGVLLGAFIGLGVGNPVQAATFTFSFNNVNGAVNGTVSGMIVLPNGNGTFAASSLSITGFPSALNLGAPPINFVPPVNENSFTVSNGNITSGHFNANINGNTAFLLASLVFGNAGASALDLLNCACFGTQGVRDTSSSTLTFAVAATPLPAALPLFATGLGVLGLLGWRRKRKAAALAA